MCCSEPIFRRVVKERLMGLGSVAWRLLVIFLKSKSHAWLHGGLLQSFPHYYVTAEQYLYTRLALLTTHRN